MRINSLDKTIHFLLDVGRPFVSLLPTAKIFSQRFKAGHNTPCLVAKIFVES
jgi:hypothetical protein